MYHLFYSPDAIQLSQVISQATAPAFILGAVAGFVSILLGRMTAVVERIRHLNEIADDETSRAHLTHPSAITTTFLLYFATPAGMTASCDATGAVSIIGRWKPFV